MNEMTFNNDGIIQEAKKQGRKVIAFSHAVSELLINLLAALKSIF